VRVVYGYLPIARSPICIGSPEEGTNWKSISPSSSPLLTSITWEINLLAAIATSARKALRGMAEDTRCSVALRCRSKDCQGLSWAVGMVVDEEGYDLVGRIDCDYL